MLCRRLEAQNSKTGDIKAHQLLPHGSLFVPPKVTMTPSQIQYSKSTSVLPVTYCCQHELIEFRDARAIGVKVHHIRTLW